MVLLEKTSGAPRRGERGRRPRVGDADSRYSDRMHSVLSAAILVTFAAVAGAQQQPAPRQASYRMQFLHSDCF